jgi:hypothetical protein
MSAYDASQQQHRLGKVHKPFANNPWLPGNLITTIFVVLA